MKNSHFLLPHLDDTMRPICAYDTREIDNPRPHHWVSLSYRARIDTVLGIIKRRVPSDGAVRIGDFACAQGNVALMLAEAGYRVVALDMRLDFLRYSRLKYERGAAAWIVANLDRPCFKPGTFDAVILGELIEHCAHPERIVGAIAGLLRPGGLIVVTTPNGSRLHAGLPLYGSVRDGEGREDLERRQYGPEGEDHLCLFTRDEIRHIVPEGFRLVESGYTGGTVLTNRFTFAPLRLIPVPIVRRLIRWGARIPLLNRMTYNNIYAVLRKDEG